MLRAAWDSNSVEGSQRRKLFQALLRFQALSIMIGKVKSEQSALRPQRKAYMRPPSRAIGIRQSGALLCPNLLRRCELIRC
jgi:hypothetical protein